MEGVEKKVTTTKAHFCSLSGLNFFPPFSLTVCACVQTTLMHISRKRVFFFVYYIIMIIFSLLPVRFPYKKFLWNSLYHLLCNNDSVHKKYISTECIFSALTSQHAFSLSRKKIDREGESVHIFWRKRGRREKTASQHVKFFRYTMYIYFYFVYYFWVARCASRFSSVTKLSLMWWFEMEIMSGNGSHESFFISMSIFMLSSCRAIKMW